jgi:hypothetical protein
LRPTDTPYSRRSRTCSRGARLYRALHAHAIGATGFEG